MNGWVCPKCGKVYAPDVKECAECNQRAIPMLYPNYPVYPVYPTFPWYPQYPNYPTITWGNTKPVESQS